MFSRRLLVSLASLATVFGLAPSGLQAERVEPGGAPPAGSGAVDVNGFVRVIDGDTVETWIDGKRAGIGLLGIKAPQLNTACGKQARALLSTLAQGGLRLEEDLSVTFDGRGRRIYEARTRDGRSVAEELVKDGSARPDGRGRERARLAEAEGQARAAGRSCVSAQGAADDDDAPAAATSFKADDPIDGAPASTATTFMAAAAMPSGFTEEVVASGLTDPTAFAFLPDGRILIAEKRGVVRVVKNGALLPTAFVDIRSRVNSYWDRGLLGIAADPNFASNGFVYLLYVYENDAAKSTDTKTARLTRVTASGDVASPSSEVVILGKNAGSSCGNFPAGADCLPADGPSHSMGNVKFAPDGNLFVTIGDASHFNYVDDNALRAQSLDSLAGKVLRITPSGAGVPGNPFWNGDAAAARSKVWAYGVRNAFRFNLRPGSGVPYVSDVGWNTWEEVNAVPAGANLGWPCYEGNARQGGYEPKAPCQALYGRGVSAVQAPLVAYGHDGRQASATGGAFYTGTSYPAQYQGAYFYADYVQGWIRYLKVNDSNAVTQAPADFVTGALAPVALESGPGGDLHYIAIRTGELRRIRYNAGGGPVACSVGQYRAEYFTNQTLSGSPTLTRCEERIDYDWGDGGPGNGIGIDNFSVRWTGRHGFAAGEFAFTAVADDGIRAWLDGAPLIDGWKDQAPTEYRANRTVTAGEHEVKVEYYEVDYGATARFSWAAAGAANTAPTSTISAPAPSLRFKVGDAITYSGSATDAQDGTIPPSGLSWTINLHHCAGASCHVHPSFTTGSGASGSFTVPDHGDGTKFEIVLTATDSGGLTGSATVMIEPQTVQLTLATTPGGLQVVHNGDTGTAPLTVTTIVDSTHTIYAPSPQGSNTFASWSDGGTQQHDVKVGAANAAYTATFTTGGSSGSGTYLSDLSWTSMSNGWGPVEKDKSNGEDGAGEGRTLSLNGATYAKGLGAHAWSDIRYALNGGCTRFTAQVGIDDEVGADGSAIFQVWADGTKLWESGRLTGAMPATGLDVDLTGRQELRLAVIDGDGTAYDHADWADAKLTCGGGGGDTTPPTVSGVTPADGATNVAITANVTATFSEAMNPATLTTSTVTLVRQGSTTPVGATVGYDAARRRVTLDPSASLRANTIYVATIKGGASGAKDAAGNPLAADKAWTITTAP